MSDNSPLPETYDKIAAGLIGFILILFVITVLTSI